MTPFTIQPERTHSRRRCPVALRRRDRQPHSRDGCAAILSALGNLPAITGETIDAATATSPAERMDAQTDAEPQTDAETRLQAFKAAYMALMDASRREPVKYS